MTFVAGGGQPEQSVESPPQPTLGCFLTSQVVMVLMHFGQKDFKLQRELTCIPVTFDMLIYGNGLITNAVSVGLTHYHKVTAAG